MTAYRYFLIVFTAIVLATALPTVASAAPVAVLNGADVPAGEYPWMVGIAQADVQDGYAAQFCGGTVIASAWVLTAAHCTYDLNEHPFAPADLDIIVGRSQLSSSDGERVAVDRIIRHEQFTDATLGDDIALLHLSQAITVAPLRLSHTVSALAFTQQPATIIGWGVTAAGAGADTLQEAQVPLVAQNTCNGFYNNYGAAILTSMLCAGDGSGATDACVGDSGGPLVVWQAALQQWEQIGIISWGAECGTPGAYGVYTNVNSFLDWIQAQTGVHSHENQ